MSEFNHKLLTNPLYWIFIIGCIALIIIDKLFFPKDNKEVINEIKRITKSTKEYRKV